ncbi:hypothetical protein [Rossellomorea aquimaris]|uniref:Uncharacterized protein n=1 Tax=Rossellomorea aquimaris TaxID=189382 RepID=A0A5D4UHV5_9BACI|nr:hypothetical protein [Rossellomorea aquimaris]TYS77603.1 hypothetical protein FZD05_13325 [Rossellomorea aquimaris]TYS86784.1 hypothetical protein FZC85_07220 [Rossellomorea aquimaris]
MKDSRVKNIGIVHLIYLGILSLLVIVLLVSYIFSGSEYAGALLNFGATLSSILLAVIAIIITLIDVAGQRSNIFDVKNSVEELKGVAQNFSNLQEEYIKNNEIIRQQISDLIKKQNELNTLTSTLSTLIEDSQNNEDKDEVVQELNKGLKEVKEILNKQSNNTYTIGTAGNLITDNLNYGRFDASNIRVSDTMFNMDNDATLVKGSLSSKVKDIYSGVNIK